MATEAIKCHRNYMSEITTGEKKASLRDAFPSLIVTKREKDEDTNSCTTDDSSTSSILLEAEKTPGHKSKSHGNLKEKKHLTDNIGDDEGSDHAIISTLQINGHDIAKTLNSQVNSAEVQTILDLPTDITCNSSILNDNDDNCSLDTVSTLGLDSSLNNNPRCIFRRYWDGNDPNILQKIAAPNSSTLCRGEASVRRHKLSKGSRSSSFSSDKDEYEKVLRGHEAAGTTVLPRTVTNGDKFDTPDNIEISDVNELLTKIEKYNSLQDGRVRTVLNNSTSRHHSKDRIPKVCSTSALPSKRPQRSCLRSRSNSISEGGTVTFNPNVSTMKYVKQRESYANTGWSKWFV